MSISDNNKTKSNSHHPYQPFGTLIGKLSYSQMVHIKTDDLLFFKSIATNEEEDDILRSSILESMMSSKSLAEDEVEEQCDLQYCRKVKIRIKEVHTSNQEERVRLREKAEKDLAIIRQQEKVYSKVETRYLVMKEKHDDATNALNDLNGNIEDLENEKSDLAKEKAEMENKVRYSIYIFH